MRDLSQKGFLEMFLHQGDTEFKLTEASDALDQCLKRFTVCPPCRAELARADIFSMSSS